MKLIEIDSARGKKRFLTFRTELYKNDPGYVCTEKFILKSVLFDETDFAKRCKKLPVQVSENGRVLAQAILIYNDALPYVQISFFDALPDCRTAVERIVSRAREFMHTVGAKGIIVGLNAHISYGVGILTEGFERKISFDSQYNKSYYREYFADCRKDALSTYRAPIERAAEKFPALQESAVKIRFCDLRRFAEETERMRQLCEQTIARTHLYFRTCPLHFYQLIKTLKLFLRPENLLFAEDETGRAVGFLFWHPDYNQMLEGGREYSLAGIAARWLFYGKRIDTAKLNAIGSLSFRATFALIGAFYRLVRERYSFVETNFIWDNNDRSSRLAKRFFGTHDRKYEVYCLK